MNRKKKAYPTKLCRRRQHLPKESQRDTSKKYLLQHPWHARLYRYFHLGIAAFSECWFYGWPIWFHGLLTGWGSGTMKEWWNPTHALTFFSCVGYPQRHGLSNYGQTYHVFHVQFCSPSNPGIPFVQVEIPIVSWTDKSRIVDAQKCNQPMFKFPQTHISRSNEGFPKKKCTENPSESESESVKMFNRKPIAKRGPSFWQWSENRETPKIAIK